MNKVQPGVYDYFILMLLAAILGGSFSLTKIAMLEMSATMLVTVRLAFASLIFFLCMFWMGQRLPSGSRIWLSIFGVALFGNTLPFFLISWGQGKVDAGLAAILMATMPLMTVVIAHFFTHDEKLTPYRIIGFFLGLLGVAALIGFDKLGTLGDSAMRQYAITGGALCYAISSVMSKSIVHLPRIAMMAALMLSSTLMIVPFSLANGDFTQIFSREIMTENALFAAIILGILPTAIGTMMIFAIITRHGASFFSQINFMVPVFGLLWGTLFLFETIPGNAVLALALILGGVAIARIQPKK